MALHTIIRLGIVASTVLPYAYAEPNPDALAACKTLEQKFPKQVADSFAEFANPPIGVTYTETRHDYWSQANADVKPACIFFPKTAEDIQFAVQTLNKYPDAPWAVKGGGHNPNVGFSSTQDGVLIATHEHMAKTTMDDDKNARVGPGCKWIDVMKALEPFGRATVSGRLGVVGAAGLTLGGGLSFLSAEHGMVADNVVEYQVVTAEGELTRANKDQNNDLFYALKGGGNQFAIVTEFVMMTYEIGPVWGGHKIYSYDQKDALLEATHNLVSDYHDPKAAVIVTYTSTLDSLIDIFVVFYFYNGPDAGEILDDFQKIPALIDATKSNQKYVDLLKDNSFFSLEGMRYLIRTGTFPNLPGADGLDLYHYGLDSFNDLAKKYQLDKLLDNYAFSMAYQPVPTIMANASVNNPHGVNLLGLDPRHGDKIFMEYDLSWLTSRSDQMAAAALTNITQPLQDYGRSKYKGAQPTHYESGDVDFTNWNPLFLNDAMYNQDAVQSYGDDTFAKLSQIQKSRDPAGFFSKRTGGPRYA